MLCVFARPYRSLRVKEPMLIRIVKMTFRPESTDEFEAIFAEVRAKIRTQPGCHELRLLKGDENIYFTYSRWENDAALQAYRYSRLFEDTWKRTKRLFAERAEAWSTKVLYDN